MGASQITKPIMEQTPVKATVAEGLLEEANVSAWRPIKTRRDRKMVSFSVLSCAQFPGGCFVAGGNSLATATFIN